MTPNYLLSETSAQPLRPRGRVVAVWDGREYSISSIYVDHGDAWVCSLGVKIRWSEEACNRIVASLRIGGQHELFKVLEDFAKRSDQDDCLRIDFTTKPPFHSTVMKRS